MNKSSKKKMKGSVSFVQTTGKYRADFGHDYVGVYKTQAEAWEALRAKNICESGLEINSLRNVGRKWFRKRHETNKILYERGDYDRVIRCIDQEESSWRTHIETAKFIDYAIKDITPKMISNWLEDLQKKNATGIIRQGKGAIRFKLDRKVGRDVIKKARIVLNSIFKYAIHEGYTSNNPVLSIAKDKQTKPKKARKRNECLTLDEIDRIFSLDLTAKDRAFYAIAIYCGLRLGEIWGLRWENIELDGSNPKIHVEHSYNGPPKSDAGFRDVPLFRFPREALLRYKKENGIIRGIGLVFPAYHGGCHCKGYPTNWIDRKQKGQSRKGVRTLAGIDRNVHVHDLRHTFASHLVMGSWGRTWNLYEVKEVLGHESITTTERYSHLLPDSIANAAKEMDI